LGLQFQPTSVIIYAWAAAAALAANGLQFVGCPAQPPCLYAIILNYWEIFIGISLNETSPEIGLPKTL